MKKNQATYKGTSGWMINAGVKGLNIFNNGLVNFTKAFIKKNWESSLWNIFIATLPTNVHMMIPRI